MKKHAFASLLTLFALRLVIDANPAKAVLNYNIYESLGNLVVETSGSLNLPASTGIHTSCLNDGILAPTYGLVCTGLGSSTLPINNVSGPASFQGTNNLWKATSVSGIATGLGGIVQHFFIDSSYVSGTPIISNAIFSGKSLADIGLTPTSGILGTWTLTGTGDTINVKVVPGPLSLAGAGVAFGFSRRLRQRIQRSQAGAKA
jgi:hypothetical protein